ncbi:MAG: PQQ-binding-like beta-propeller repeat protein, partial [Anaerolineales bacterium]
YVACLDHILYAVRARDGVLLWQTERLEGAIASSPVLSEDGILYFGTFGNRFHAFDPRSQQDLWTYTASHWVWGSPLLIEDQIILTDLSGNVIALDAKSGDERWKVATGAAITAKPTFYNDVIYIGNEAGDLYAIDLQGNLVWQQPKKFDGKILSTILSGDEVILVPLIAKDQLIVALNPDGGQSWSFQPVK